MTHGNLTLWHKKVRERDIDHSLPSLLISPSSLSSHSSPFNKLIPSLPPFLLFLSFRMAMRLGRGTHFATLRQTRPPWRLRPRYEKKEGGKEERGEGTREQNLSIASFSKLLARVLVRVSHNPFGQSFLS